MSLNLYLSVEGGLAHFAMFLKPCKVMARLIAVVANWWNLSKSGLHSQPLPKSLYRNADARLANPPLTTISQFVLRDYVPGEGWTCELPLSIPKAGIVQVLEFRIEDAY